MNAEQAILLYSKNWFEEEDIIDDLCKLLTPIYLHDFDIEDVFQVMTDMVQKAIGGSVFRFQDFMNDLQPSRAKFYLRNKKRGHDPFLFQVISKYLSVLSLLNHDEIIEKFGPLCRPEYSILKRPDRISDETINRVFGNESPKLP